MKHLQWKSSLPYVGKFKLACKQIVEILKMFSDHELVNDRSAKNQVRPNRTGSVNLTEGWAEPQSFLVQILAQFWSNIDQNIAQS